jgi:hypothetical protein
MSVVDRTGDDGMCTARDELRGLVLEVGVFVLGDSGADGEVTAARREMGIIESIFDRMLMGRNRWR